MEEWTAQDRMHLGARLREARQAKGMTLLEVGEIFEIKKAAVGHWETGTNVPRADVVARLAEIYAVDVSWLLTGQRAAWPFTNALRALLASQPEGALRRFENGLRAHFDMPLLDLAQAGAGEAPAGDDHAIVVDRPRLLRALRDMLKALLGKPPTAAQDRMVLSAVNGAVLSDHPHRDDPRDPPQNLRLSHRPR